MKKTDAVFLGEKVRTKKTFKPQIRGDKTFTPPKDTFYEGIVIGRRINQLIVKFDKQYPFTYRVDDMVSEPVATAIDYKDLEQISNVEIEDQGARAFVGAMREESFDKISNFPQIKQRFVNDIAGMKADLRNYGETVERIENDLVNKNFALEDAIANNEINTKGTGDILAQYESLMASNKIDSVEIVKSGSTSFMIVTTNDLIYTPRPNTNCGRFIIGAFKFRINLAGGRVLPKVANYKRHMRRSDLHHPCISNFNLCLGGDMQSEMYALSNRKAWITLVYTLINFLENPNYGSPYVADIEFSCAQAVTIRPRNPLDWFSPGYWESNEKWDGRLHTANVNKLSGGVAQGVLTDAEVEAIDPTIVAEPVVADASTEVANVAQPANAEPVTITSSSEEIPF